MTTHNSITLLSDSQKDKEKEMNRKNWKDSYIKKLMFQDLWYMAKRDLNVYKVRDDIMVDTYMVEWLGENFS